MSKVDDELTRRFHRVEHPVDVDGLFEGLERRRSHRERVRRIQAGILAVAVITATVAGFVGLRAVFDETGTDIGEPTDLPGNGEVVFVADAEDGRIHLFASAPDGSRRRQLTDDDTLDSDAVVSPDGRAVAFARGIGPESATIAIVPIEGGPITWQTTEHYNVTDPAWSPDGSRIAFISHTADAEARLYVAEVGTDAARQIPIDALEPAHPTWSPDGTRIAVAAYRGFDGPSPAADLAIVRVDDGSFEWLELSIDDGDEQAPAWSPDGAHIAYLRQGSEGHEVWTTTTDGRSGTLVATAIEAQLMNDLDWAPDGTSLLVSDGQFVYRVDATTGGDPRENFVQLFRGFSPSWQPVSAGGEPSVTPAPEPSVSASPAPEGRDIGLGVMLCDLETLDGIDWDGSGIDGAAWTGAPVDEEGSCRSAELAQHIVAVDRDGDGVAEQGSTSTLRSCLLCQPFDTVDLNEDGLLELVVLEEASSRPTYSFYEVNRPGSERAKGVYPIFVAEPGHEEAGIAAGEPLRIDAGGDEGYNSEIVCHDSASEPPVLTWTWVLGAVDTNDPVEWHYAEIELWDDGMFHVVGSNDSTIPANEAEAAVDQTAPSCGIDWHPSA